MGLFMLRIALQDWCVTSDHKKEKGGGWNIYETGKGNARN
jgi:hypothetical protein